MTNLNELKITNREFDLDSGFFWVEFEGGKSLQCCVHESSKPEKVVINESDCGHDWGICKDVNQWAVEEGLADWWDVNQSLMSEAEKIGISIIVE